MDDTRVNTIYEANWVSSRTPLVRSGINLIGFFIGDDMKQIPVGKNHIAVVDDGDYGLISQYKWRLMRKLTTCYAITHIYVGRKRTTTSMHRLILGAKKGEIIDHQDHDGLNNRRYNIRLCTSRQNNMNRQKPKNGTSVFKGVSWDAISGKWKAAIMLNNKGKHLGYYLSEVEAAKAYDTAAIELFDEFACTNFSFQTKLLEKNKWHGRPKPHKCIGGGECRPGAKDGSRRFE